MQEERFSQQFVTIHHRDLLISWLVSRANERDIVTIIRFIDENKCADEELVSAIAVDTYVVYCDRNFEMVAIAVLGCVLNHSSTLNGLLAESVRVGLPGAKLVEAFTGVSEAVRAKLTDAGFDPDAELAELLDRYGLSNV